jgi:signal transduction histidine kinase
MSERAKRSVVLGAVLLVVAGVAMQWISAAVRQKQERTLLEASLDSVAKLRRLDRILVVAVRDEAGRAEALEAVSDWQKTAPGEQEPQHAAAIRRCLEGGDCEGGLATVVQAAKDYLSATFGELWQETDRTGVQLLWIGRSGALLVLLAAAAAAAAGLRRRRDEGAGPRDAATDAVEIKELLKQRSEQLYDAQLKAWETERFAAYGEIVAGLSHGLKTPLAGIRAAAQLARAKVGPDSPACTQLDDIVQATDGLVEQVRRLLKATDSSSPVPVLVEPKRVLASIDQEYGAAARERGLGWKVDATADVGPVLVDPASLIMALRNVIENALAASPEGGTVSVWARACEAPARAGQTNQPPPAGTRWVEIVVQDEGPGVPEEVVAGEEIESSKLDGSGLGVAIARRIVARYGGALVSENAEEGGARVAAKLPLASSRTLGESAS